MGTMTYAPSVGPRRSVAEQLLIAFVMSVFLCCLGIIFVVAVGQPVGPESHAPVLAKPKSVVFTDGTRIVGGEGITPGTYTVTATGACTWVRQSIAAPSVFDYFKAIIADGTIAAGHTGTVTITPTDKGFESHHCGTWIRSNR